jgi:hypothetical protein
MRCSARKFYVNLECGGLPPLSGREDRIGILAIGD